MATFTLAQSQKKKGYLLPSANGSNIDLDFFPDTGETNYEDVDDPVLTPDEDSTYVFTDVTDWDYKVDYDRHGAETTYDCCSTVTETDYFVFGVSKDGDNDYWLHAALWNGTDISIGNSDDLAARDGITPAYCVDSEWYYDDDSLVVCVAGTGDNGDNFWYTCDNRPMLTYVDSCMVSGDPPYDVSIHEMNGTMYAHIAAFTALNCASFDGTTAASVINETNVDIDEVSAVWADTISTTTSYIYYGGSSNYNGNAGFDAWLFDEAVYTHTDVFDTTYDINDINGDPSTGTIYIAMDSGYIGAYSFDGTTITELATKNLGTEDIYGIHLGCSGYIFARTETTLYKLTFDGSTFSSIAAKSLCDNCKRAQRHGLAADSAGIYNTGDSGYFCARTCDWSEYEYDLYDLPAWSECTIGCSIDSIKVFSRGRGTAVVPSGAEYRILIAPEPPAYHQSPDQDICDAYKMFRYGWALNPSTGVGWEWADLDDLEIGVGLVSKAMSYNIEETLKSDGAGNYTEWTAPIRSCGCGSECDGTNWNHVNPDYYACCYSGNPPCYIVRDEADATGNETYTYENGAGLGTVNSVTVLIKARNGYGQWEEDSYLRAMVRIGATDYYGDKWDLEPDYRWYSYTWDTNPAGGAWDWAAVNALEAGHNSEESSDALSYYIEQVLVKVNYTYNDTVPFIRCTQTYAEINYTCDEECTLTKPEQISTNHARNVKMLNFWNGNREVYDLNRSGKSMVLTGRETGSAACDTIICLRNMARDGNIITISELNPDYFNGDYRITSFGWNEISEKPSHFKWILSLESAD